MNPADDYEERDRKVMERLESLVISEEATNSEKLQEIWETLIRDQPSRHRMSGWSVDHGELTHILGRDGKWHDIRHDLNSPESDAETPPAH